jgi:hypothetical protein
MLGLGHDTNNRSFECIKSYITIAELAIITERIRNDTHTFTSSVHH